MLWASYATRASWWRFSNYITQVIVEDGVTFLEDKVPEVDYGLPELTRVEYRGLSDPYTKDGYYLSGTEVFYECPALAAVAVPADYQGRNCPIRTLKRL